MFRRLTTTQLVVDLVVAVVFLAVTGPMLITPQSGLSAAWSIPVSVVMAGALALRRLSPSLALAAAWAGALLQMALGLSPMPSNIAILAVLYTTAAYGTRLVLWLGFASAFVGALVITLYLFLGPAFAGGGLSWHTLPLALVTLLAAGFALGLAWTCGALVRSTLRTRDTLLAQQRAQAEAQAEQERVRIARDMHDVVAHSLAVVIAQADGARYAARADPDAAATALGTISTTARAALADVRLLLTQLRHSQGDGPQPTVADLEGLYAQVRAAGVDLSIDVDPAPHGEPPAAVQIAVYRILQEALTNALRHGEGAPVHVRLGWWPDRVELAVSNPSRIVTVPVGSGHGLVGMGERAALAGGRLVAEPRDGWFTVHATLPIGAVA
ncbi:sensor histidine kinase [Microbacterium sp. CJ88]|uniref:sensor histidine kinase n=1 Tax=Microbacterium sp. CJ88 TaxID=3445672 RepID=UPI003F656685